MKIISFYFNNYLFFLFLKGKYIIRRSKFNLLIQKTRKRFIRGT
jgi:hypothetical protein